MTYGDFVSHVVLIQSVCHYGEWTLRRYRFGQTCVVSTHDRTIRSINFKLVGRYLVYYVEVEIENVATIVIDKVGCNAFAIVSLRIVTIPVNLQTSAVLTYW